MKILVTGSNGQLGNELRELSDDYSFWEFVFTDEKELDITSEDQVNSYFAAENPDVVINCAAYTAVDKAESEEEKARLINAAAPGILSRASAKYDSLLIHISTDYVFDGRSCIPYTENDKINPGSVYGKTKAEGEKAIQESAQKAIIIRTSWLYSSYGTNFVKSILRFTKERQSLNIVFDQAGTPTYARDLAKTILQIIPAATKNNGIEIFHYSNEGVISWYDFAKAIVEEKGISFTINPIISKDFPQAAPRPFYSVLNKGAIKEKFSIEIPYWKDSLRECLKKLS